MAHATKDAIPKLLTQKGSTNRQEHHSKDVIRFYTKKHPFIPWEIVEKPSASVDNTFQDLQNSSYHPYPHPIIVHDAGNCY